MHSSTALRRPEALVLHRLAASVHLRNSILQAAADQTLLRLTYNGSIRLIEPYSLAYKIRTSDGIGQEYFYDYDRTGGRSGPGIKSFVRGGISHIANTDTKFTPRFPLELAKSPGRERTGYFGSPFGSRGRLVPDDPQTAAFGADLHGQVQRLREPIHAQDSIYRAEAAQGWARQPMSGPGSGTARDDGRRLALMNPKQPARMEGYPSARDLPSVAEMHAQLQRLEASDEVRSA